VATPIKSNPIRDNPLWELWDVFKVSLNLTKQLFSLQARHGLLNEAPYQHTPVNIAKLLHLLSQFPGNSNTYNTRHVDPVKQ